MDKALRPVPNLIVLPILIFLIALLIRKGLSPLYQVSQALKGRGYKNLEEIQASDYPIELRYLVGELNDLFNRVSEASERERRFTADAAHELRTPLSITKVHLQNILQVSKSEQVREFVTKALVGVDRLIHMVRQLLILSRLDADQEQEALKILSLGSILGEIIEELKNQDFMSHKNIVVCNTMNIQWNSRETQTRILLRNLLDNACRYAEEHTQITVDFSDKDIVIRNVCALMSEALLQQSLERFKRVSSSQQGSGLGLSICTQICRQNNYSFSMHNRKDGEQGIEVIISIL